MYSVLRAESSVVFAPAVAATSSPSLLRAKTSVPFDGGLPTFVDESVDFAAARRRPPAGVVASPLRSATADRSDCFVASPADRSTPLRPAKRDRAADDDDRQILRCKRSLETAATSRLGGGSQSAAVSTFESVERRNQRERRRVKLINVTFATLRNRLPSYCWHQRRQQQQHCRERRQRENCE